MNRERIGFFAKLAAGLAAIGVAVGLMATGKLPIDKGIEMVIKGVDAVSQSMGVEESRHEQPLSAPENENP